MAAAPGTLTGEVPMNTVSRYFPRASQLPEWPERRGNPLLG
jgi:hypothetical protein